MRGRVVAVLLGLAPAASVMAQAAPSYDTLLERLDQLPGTRVGAALAEPPTRADQARAHCPSLSWSVGNAWGTGSYGGMGKADSVLTLSQPLEVWGQRGARVRAARAEAQAANLRGTQSRSDVASQLAVVYAQAESALRRYTLAEEALSLTRDDANAVNAMVKQGREPQLRAVQAQSEVANANAALDEAQAFRDAALARLAGAALLDAPVQSIGDACSTVRRRCHAGPPIPHWRCASLKPKPMRRANWSSERKRALPDLSVTAAQTRFREGGERAYNLGLSLSIPLFDRNRGGIRAANADQRATKRAWTSSAATARRHASAKGRREPAPPMKAWSPPKRRIAWPASASTPDASRSWNCAARAALLSPPAPPPWMRACRASARKSILPALKGAHPLWRPHDSLPYFSADRRHAADCAAGRLRWQRADTCQ